MKVTENSDEIIIRHVPVAKWISGGILAFIFGGFCLWLIFSAIINPRSFLKVETDELIEFLPILFFIAASALAVFIEFKLISMICAPLVTVAVSQKLKSVNILTRRIYGAKTERYFFHQIQKFKSYKSKVDFSSRYFLALVLVNQKAIKLKIPISDKQNTIKLVKKLNKFIKVQKASINNTMV
jgi:hypothetical protein